jgi:ketosteroid isomerase-like protein
LSLTTLEFRRLLQRVADSWNAGDSRRAAECFAEDAVYSEPPDTQLYSGRAELFRFFGGDEMPDPPMQMAWHNLVFDEDAQVGAGEYTFQAQHRYHGAVFVRVRGGLIANWREYQYRSDLDWDAFVGENVF